MLTTTEQSQRWASPPQVPPSFWSDRRLLQALADRHMGQVIRAFRLHQDHWPVTIPQGAVARWLGTKQGSISAIENRVSPSRDIRWLQRVARTLRIPRDLLWFYVDPYDEDPAAERDGMRTLRVTLPAGSSRTFVVGGAGEAAEAVRVVVTAVGSQGRVLGHAAATHLASRRKKPGG